MKYIFTIEKSISQTFVDKSEQEETIDGGVAGYSPLEGEVENAFGGCSEGETSFPSWNLIIIFYNLASLLIKAGERLKMQESLLPL